MEALLINLLIHSFIFFTFHSWCLSPEGVNTYTNRSLTTRTYARARALGAHKRYELHEGLENTGGPATSRRWHPDLAHLGWGAGGGGAETWPRHRYNIYPHPFPLHILRARPQPHYYLMCENRVAPAVGQHTCFASGATSPPSCPVTLRLVPPRPFDGTCVGCIRLITHLQP